MPNEVYMPGSILNEINEASRRLQSDGAIDVPTNTASFLATVVVNVGTNELVGIHPLTINDKLLDARIGLDGRWYMHRGAPVDVYSDPENGVKADIAQLIANDPLLANRLKLIVQGIYDASTEPEPPAKEEETQPETPPVEAAEDSETPVEE